MKGGEAKFWHEIRIPLRGMGDVDRIESHATSIGRPDVNICLNPGITWDIELKYSDAGKVKLRPAQRMWFSKRRGVKAKACVFTKAVINGTPVYFLNMINHIPEGDRLDDWINSADIVWDRKMDYAQLEGILREKECWKT
jgi:hypothetical protein